MPWVQQTDRRERGMFFLILLRREDGRIDGLRAHADVSKVIAARVKASSKQERGRERMRGKAHCR
jgi:hypothetical protein